MLLLLLYGGICRWGKALQGGRFYFQRLVSGHLRYKE